jgi:hypothetical protein
MLLKELQSDNIIIYFYSQIVIDLANGILFRLILIYIGHINIILEHILAVWQKQVLQIHVVLFLC